MLWNNSPKQNTITPAVCGQCARGKLLEVTGNFLLIANIFGGRKGDNIPHCATIFHGADWI